MMKTNPMLKYLRKKHRFMIILGLMTICCAMISAVDYTMSIFLETSNREIFYDDPINFYAKTNRYNITHPLLKSAIEESIFEIEGEYTADLYYFQELSLVFNYDAGIDSITEQKGVTKMYIIGIDEALYNRLQQQDYGRFLRFPRAWDEFAGHISLFSSYDEKYPVQMANMSILHPNQNSIHFTNEFSNLSQAIPINQHNSIFDFKKIYEMFGIRPRDINLQNPLVIGDKEAIHTLFQNFTTSHSLADIILVNQDYLDRYSSFKIKTECRSLYDHFNDGFKRIEFGMGFHLTELDSADPFYGIELTFWVVIFLIPLLFVSYRLIRSAFKTLLNQEKQELGLLLLGGIPKKHLKFSLLGFFSFLGFLGGMIGTLTGILLANQIGKYVFSHFDFSVISMLQYYQSNLIQNCLVYGLISGIITFLFFRKPMKQLFMKDLSTLISEGDNQEKTPRLQRNVDFVWLLVGILTITYYLYLQIDNNTWFSILSADLEFKEGIEGLHGLTQLLIPIFPIIPFIFPLVLIRSVFQHLPAFFKTMKTKFSRTRRSRERTLNFKLKMIVWGFKTKWTQYRTELQNFTLCIVIITMFMSLNQSFIYTNSVYDSLMQGNGELLNVYLEDSASLADLTESTRTIENNLDTLNLEALNAIYYTGSVQNYFHLENIYITHQDLTSKRDLYQSGYKFCTTNYSKILDNMVLRDEWFVGGSASEILTALNEQEDAVLFPTSMCKGNFSIGGPITFSYKTLNGTIVNRKGTIIGTYNMFPTMVPSASIFMNPLLLETALISKLEIVLYNPDPITPAQHADFQSLCRVNIAQYINFQLVVLQVEYPLFKLLFRFLKIYTILVIIFTLIGISLNIFFNYSKKNIQQGLIRAYGYRKRDLIKLNLQENGIFALFGVIFSLFSFIGTGFYILIINVSTIAQFPLFYRIDYGVYFLTLSIGGFLFIGLNILFSFRSIMQTDTKKNLEKILRYRY